MDEAIWRGRDTPSVDIWTGVNRWTCLLTELSDILAGKEQAFLRLLWPANLAHRTGGMLASDLIGRTTPIKTSLRGQKGEFALPNEMTSTSKQMGRSGGPRANGIDSARFDVRDVIIGGGIAGILAGMVMAAAAMLYAAADGSGFLLPVRTIAATWYGANALLGGVGVLIVGLATHLGTAAFGGVAFAALPSSRKSATVALLSGLVWGVVVWAILSFAVMPWLSPTMYAGTVGKEPGWWFVLHLIYGGMLVVTPSVVRRVSANRPAAELTQFRRAA